MIGENISFQTFYTSKEESNCPLITEFVRIDRNIEKKGFSKDIDSLTSSMRYGKRVIINSDYEKIGEISRRDILEIVDYDPVKKTLLVIGPKKPKVDSSVHWMIHHARSEINAVVQLNGQKILEKFEGKIPSTENEQTPGSFEMIKEVLKILRDSKSVFVKNYGIIFVGNGVNDVEGNILNVYKKIGEKQ